MAAKVCKNAAAVTFAKCGASTGATPITHFGIGTADSGAGQLLYSDALSASIPLTANVTQPSFAIDQLTIAITGDVSDLLTELWLKHIFTNTAIANLGDVTGLPATSVAGSLYISLHTGAPGATGTQLTSEATYTNYLRVAVARSAAGWTVA